MKDGTYGLLKFGIGRPSPSSDQGITILVNSIIRYLYIDALFCVCVCVCVCVFFCDSV